MSINKSVWKRWVVCPTAGWMCSEVTILAESRTMDSFRLGLGSYWKNSASSRPVKPGYKLQSLLTNIHCILSSFLADVWSLWLGSFETIPTCYHYSLLGNKCSVHPTFFWGPLDVWEEMTVLGSKKYWALFLFDQVHLLLNVPVLFGLEASMLPWLMAHLIL